MMEPCSHLLIRSPYYDSRFISTRTYAGSAVFFSCKNTNNTAIIVATLVVGIIFFLL